MKTERHSEHERKYDELATRLGRAKLSALVAPLADRVRAALTAGDEHLNTIPLGLWDRLALDTPTNPPEPRNCPTCGQHRPGSGLGKVHSADWPQSELRASARSEPWSAAPSLSLAERVCVLKHMAKLAAGD